MRASSCEVQLILERISNRLDSMDHLLSKDWRQAPSNPPLESTNEGAITPIFDSVSPDIIQLPTQIAVDVDHSPVDAEIIDGDAEIFQEQDSLSIAFKDAAVSPNGVQIPVNDVSGVSASTVNHQPLSHQLEFLHSSTKSADSEFLMHNRSDNNVCKVVSDFVRMEVEDLSSKSTNWFDTGWSRPTKVSVGEIQEGDSVVGFQLQDIQSVVYQQVNGVSTNVRFLQGKWALSISTTLLEAISLNFNDVSSFYSSLGYAYKDVWDPAGFSSDVLCLDNIGLTGIIIHHTQSVIKSVSHIVEDIFTVSETMIYVLVLVVTYKIVTPVTGFSQEEGTCDLKFFQCLIMVVSARRISIGVSGLVVKKGTSVVNIHLCSVLWRVVELLNFSSTQYKLLLGPKCQYEYAYCDWCCKVLDNVEKHMQQEIIPRTDSSSTSWFWVIAWARKYFLVSNIQLHSVILQYREAAYSSVEASTCAGYIWNLLVHVKSMSTCSRIPSPFRVCVSHSITFLWMVAWLRASFELSHCAPVHSEWNDMPNYMPTVLSEVFVSLSHWVASLQCVKVYH